MSIAQVSSSAYNSLAPNAEREARISGNALRLSIFEKQNPEFAAWWTNSTFEFAVSLRSYVARHGNLTAGQRAAALRCIGRSQAAQNAAQPSAAERREAAPVVMTEALETAFKRAAQNGAKRPKIHLAGVRFSPAPMNGRNAGAIYVKSKDGTYLGKAQHGKFIKSYECTSDQEAEIVEICADPKSAAEAYGKEFGICCLCSRDLSDPVSVARGIGPICAANMGW